MNQEQNLQQPITEFGNGLYSKKSFAVFKNLVSKLSITSALKVSIPRQEYKIVRLSPELGPHNTYCTDLTTSELQFLSSDIKVSLNSILDNLKNLKESRIELWNQCSIDDPRTYASFLQLNNCIEEKDKLQKVYQKLSKIQWKIKRSIQED